MLAGRKGSGARGACGELGDRILMRYRRKRATGDSRSGIGTRRRLGWSHGSWATP